MDNQSKIILISGPTASGKSDFALKLAKKIDGEIINADSMQVYKQLKILTARPNKEDQRKIRHHLYGHISINKNDIEQRNLPSNTTGVVITEIDQDSPVNYLKVNNIIVEAQKKKINTIGQLDNIVKSTLRSSEKTILIAIYNNQNQRRYIGVKLK